MSKNPPKKFKGPKPTAYHSNGPHTNLLKKAIMDTLRYRQVFDCPMNYFQIWNYLIGGKNTINGNLEKELVALVEEKKLHVKDGWYSLNKIEDEEVKKRRKRAEKLMERAQQVTKYLRQVPWIEMVAVTGSVAAFNSREECDIDMFIVTRPKRLFLSRFFGVLILKGLSIYWNPKKPAGTVCPNIFLTNGHLTWEKSRQNLFTANEIALLYPLFFKNDCYFEFLKQNSWVTHYLPNVQLTDFKAPKLKNAASTGKLLDYLETALRKFQVSYMKSKKTTEIVTKNFIHFNTHDSSAEVLQKFYRQFP